MGDYRFSHSVNVAKEAKKLAKHYGADENKAEIAGILHDITKEMPKEQQLQIIIDSGIILDNVQLHAPKLWHGMSGSIVVRDELGIDDEDILNAIRYHTTGRAGMSLLEKVIFTADFTVSDDLNFLSEPRALFGIVVFSHWFADISIWSCYSFITDCTIIIVIRTLFGWSAQYQSGVSLDLCFGGRANLRVLQLYRRDFDCV